jgi:hypothetical protein
MPTCANSLHFRFIPVFFQYTQPFMNVIISSVVHHRKIVMESVKVTSLRKYQTEMYRTPRNLTASSLKFLRSLERFIA